MTSPNDTSPSDRGALLRELAGELRDAPAPEPDWAPMQERLLASLAAVDAAREAPVSSPAPPFSRPMAGGGAKRAWLGGGAVAAAAAAGLIWYASADHRGAGVHPAAGVASHRVDRATLPRLGSVDAAGTVTVDMRALRRGDVMTSGDSPLVVEDPGSVRWTLAAGARARVVTVGHGGVGHVVALEAGSLRAEVTPRAPSEGLVEAFAVDAGATRVAVHGTIFSVTLEAHEVIVDVERGAVAVGPAGGVGATTGSLLVAPRRAAFSLDGAKSSRFLPSVLSSFLPPMAGRGAQPSEEPLAAGPAELSAESRPLSDAPPAEADPAAPPRPPAPVRAAALDEPAVRVALDGCFESSYAGVSPGVRLSVVSTLQLTLRADGSIEALRFSPPLEPSFQSCASSILARSFPPGQASFSIPLTFSR